jgi:hypothetical protein
MARANLPRVVLVENNIYPNFGLIGYLSFSVLSNYQCTVGLPVHGLLLLYPATILRL